MELRQCPICSKFKFLKTLPDGTVLPCKKCTTPKMTAFWRVYARRSITRKHGTDRRQPD